MGSHRVYGGDASKALFLLGGVGTGNVSIGARGQLADWEIFNRPNKGTSLNNTFFSIYAKAKTGEPVARVLESRLRNAGEGIVPGLPRLADSTMRSEYPFVWVDFTDERLPVKVTLEAYTPFIPLDPEDSGIPCAILRYKVRNASRESVDVTVAGSFTNPVGLCDMDRFGWPEGHDHSRNVNEVRRQGGLTGMHMRSSGFAPNEFKFGDMCVSTPDPSVTTKPYWYEGGWFDGIQDFWDDFRRDGLLGESPTHDGVDSDFTSIDTSKKPKVGTIGVYKEIEGGAEADFTFILSWHFPNRVRAWDFPGPTDGGTPTVRNMYATRFDDSWGVARYVHENIGRLHGVSKAFSGAMYGGTLPESVIDAVASNITAVRSNTCMWLETGHMAAWEGCSAKAGNCFGTSTHVWNYAQTMAFLFPSLERSAREVEFCLETDGEGKMDFRTNAVFGLPKWGVFASPDGQLGAIIRAYREWRLSGDDGFLGRVWPGVKRALDYVAANWDKGETGVMEGKQHNTYDIEFHGVSSMSCSLYCAALKACSEMADYMGDGGSAGRYSRLCKTGGRAMDALLWNGEYYAQKIGDVNEYKYQYGDGCLSDQLFGQMLAHVAGLGYVLPEGHVREAMKSVHRHNFREGFAEFHNVHRSYVLSDEKGLIAGSWPRGGRPDFAFVYCDEVWTGIEYQVAAHLIYEGLVDEGLGIVGAVRERYDGHRRNPWSEVESGDHYARSLSSWAVLTALSGFKSDMVNGEIHFAPKLGADDFSAFWSSGTAWGTYSQKKDSATGRHDRKVDVLYGSLDGVRVYADGEEVALVAV